MLPIVAPDGVSGKIAWMTRFIFCLVLASDLAACSSSSSEPVPCPAQIPIGARSSCKYPETSLSKKYQYVCGYQLPCGEPTTCTCVPDFSTWYCNIDCAGGQPGCVVNSAEYSCPACASFSSTEECISNASKSR